MRIEAVTRPGDDTTAAVTVTEIHGTTYSDALARARDQVPAGAKLLYIRVDRPAPGE